MVRLIADERIQLQPEQKYIIGVDGKAYEADSIRELTACICGEDFLESQSAETDWHMRRSAAKVLGLARMVKEELEDGKEHLENVIVYDERWGKIPYSFTDTPQDNNIHVEDPVVIRIESNEIFLYTLVKGEFVIIGEKNDETGEYEDWLQKDLDSLIEKEVEKFRFRY